MLDPITTKNLSTSLQEVITNYPMNSLIVLTAPNVFPVKILINVTTADDHIIANDVTIVFCAPI